MLHTTKKSEYPFYAKILICARFFLFSFYVTTLCTYTIETHTHPPGRQFPLIILFMLKYFYFPIFIKQKEQFPKKKINKCQDPIQGEIWDIF